MLLSQAKLATRTRAVSWTLSTNFCRDCSRAATPSSKLEAENPRDCRNKSKAANRATSSSSTLWTTAGGTVSVRATWAIAPEEVVQAQTDSSTSQPPDSMAARDTWNHALTNEDRPRGAWPPSRRFGLSTFRTTAASPSETERRYVALSTKARAATYCSSRVAFRQGPVRPLPQNRDEKEALAAVRQPLWTWL